MKTALNLAKKEIVFLDRDLVFSRFYDIYQPNTSIVVAVSGGCDSMFALLLVLQFVVEAGGGYDDVIVVHCNHQTRKETDQEQALVEQFCVGLQLKIFCYHGTDFSENALRNWRWSCFFSVAQAYDRSIIVTGHHLSDRLETSLLHLYRGCHLLGLANMSMIDKKYYDSVMFCIFRPLLGSLKKTIVDECRRLDLPYVVDPSNFDHRGGKRTFMRHGVLPSLLGDNGFFLTMKSYYLLVESLFDRINDLFDLVPVGCSRYWEVRRAYKLVLDDRSMIDLMVLTMLLQKLGVYHNITQGMLLELCLFLRNSANGHFVYANLIFVVAHDDVYVFGSDAVFRQKEIADSLNINRIGAYDFGDCTLDIDSDLLGGILRFPREGDRYHGKRLKKYLLNRKIPVFWRNYIPVVTRGEEVQYVFDQEVREQYSF